jgi:hypothetical protein
LLFGTCQLKKSAYNQDDVVCTYKTVILSTSADFCTYKIEAGTVFPESAGFSPVEAAYEQGTALFNWELA